MGRTQPVNSFFRKGMLVDVASNDEYRLAVLKRWHSRSLGGDQKHRPRREGRFR